MRGRTPLSSRVLRQRAPRPRRTALASIESTSSRPRGTVRRLHPAAALHELRPPRAPARDGVCHVVEVQLAEHLADLSAVGAALEVVELEELRGIRAARGGHAREDATPEADGSRGEGGQVVREAHEAGLWNGWGGDAKG